jgi:hypothetical protein
MATFDLDSSINSLSDTAIIPCYEGHSVVQAKLLDFGGFKPVGPKVVFDALSSFISSLDMIVIAPSNTPQPVPMHLMTLEALCQAMRRKLRVEAQPLLGDEYVNAFDDLKALVEANNESSEQAMVEIQQLCYRSTFEAISCASMKELCTCVPLPRNLVYYLEAEDCIFQTRLEFQQHWQGKGRLRNLVGKLRLRKVTREIVLPR